jgi:hypothetical protein
MSEFKPDKVTDIYNTYIKWQPNYLRERNLVLTLFLSEFRDAVYGETEIDGEMVKTINIPIDRNELGISKRGKCWCNCMAVAVDEEAYNESHILLPIYSNGYYRKLRDLGYKNVKLGRTHRLSLNRGRTKAFAQEQNKRLNRYTINL